MEALAYDPIEPDDPPPGRSWRRAAIVAGALIALVVAVGFGAWQPWQRTAPTETIATAPVVPEQHPSLAVLPIVDLSGDPSGDSLAAQLDAAVRASLSRLSGLTTSEASADVRYVLDGSVRRLGGQPRVVATLIDTMTGEAVVAEPFDRSLTDVAVVQRDLVRWIVRALSITLTAEEQVAGITTPPTPVAIVANPAPSRPAAAIVTRPARAKADATPAELPRVSVSESPLASASVYEPVRAPTPVREDIDRPAQPLPPAPRPAVPSPARSMPDPVERVIPHQTH